MVLSHITEEILREIDTGGDTDIIAVFYRGRQITNTGRVKAMSVLVFCGLVKITNLTTSINPYTGEQVKIWQLSRV